MAVRHFYNRLISALKNPKSPEEYYMWLFTLPQFSDPELLQRTLDYAISPDVRSQDALGVITSVMGNPAGEKQAWDFVLAHWDAVQKAGGPFASAQVVGATSRFCELKHARSGDGFLCRTQNRGRGTHLQAIDRAH